MSVTLTLNFTTIAEAAAFLSANGGAQIAKAEVKETVAKPAPAADTKPTTAKAAIDQAMKAAEEAKAKKQAEADAAAAQAAAAQAAAAQAEETTYDLAGGAEAPKLDYDTDVKPKFQAFLKAKGREAGLALLGKYGAKSGAELPKDRLHEVLADIEAAA